ncbi:MAG: hypothetical protein KKA76_03060 [Proteobacteria bacterium]|nr:hypothetical protein [Pseudomonadota bacterium]
MDYEAKLSDIIASLPEIEGGFLYTPEKGVYGNQATGISDDENLLQVALKFSKMLSMLSVHFHDTGNFRVTFKDLVLFGMVLDQGQWLFLFHRPSLSPSMINMTVQLALNIEANEAEQRGSQELISTPPEPEPSSVSTDNDTLKILMASESKLSKPLNRIKDELSKYIGPVAELIFEEFAEEWGKKFSPTLENLPELTRVFAEEIDNDDDRKSFEKTVKAFLVEE